MCDNNFPNLGQNCVADIDFHNRTSAAEHVSSVSGRTAKEPFAKAADVAAVILDTLPLNEAAFAAPQFLSLSCCLAMVKSIGGIRAKAISNPIESDGRCRPSVRRALTKQPLNNNLRLVLPRIERCPVVRLFAKPRDGSTLLFNQSFFPWCSHGSCAEHESSPTAADNERWQ
jgi:hypothetical protein